MAYAPLARVLLGAFLLAATATASAAELERISKPGEYQGYSKEIYPDWVRTSQYITVRDGTKIALDILRPAVNGVAVETPLPVIWEATRYHRANVSDVPNTPVHTRIEARPEFKAFLAHGYVVVIADVRGSGASFGTSIGPYSQAEAWDAYDVTEWLAAQPWSDGNIGMFGVSYMGAAAIWALTTAPPHLRCVFSAEMATDSYPSVYSGGIYNKFVDKWNDSLTRLDVLMPAAPVDGDKDRSMLATAIEEHKRNRNVTQMMIDLPYRDSWDPVYQGPFYMQTGILYQADLISNSGIPIYLWEGWKDGFPLDHLLLMANITNPRKLTMQNAYHSGKDKDPKFWLVEHLRWYDYWLKGIKNGIMDEPRIRYATAITPELAEYKSTDQWPPAAKPLKLFFDSGKSGTVKSVNDGRLNEQAPGTNGDVDTYKTDYSVTTGPPNTKHVRWSHLRYGYGRAGDSFSIDMRTFDEKGLTYTSEPLGSDLTVSGSPVVHIWFSSTAKDGDFFFNLEEITPEGVSEYVTDGVIRASHRKLSKPQWDNFGLPYHSGRMADVMNLQPGEVTELVLALQPTSNLFNKGNRIRLTITGADGGKFNYLTPELNPPPTVKIYRDSVRASYLTIPVVTNPTIN